MRRAGIKAAIKIRSEPVGTNTLLAGIRKLDITPEVQSAQVALVALMAFPKGMVLCSPPPLHLAAAAESSPTRVSEQYPQRWSRPKDAMLPQSSRLPQKPANILDTGLPLRSVLDTNLHVVESVGKRVLHKGKILSTWTRPASSTALVPPSIKQG